MAQYDLTSGLVKFLDRHLVFPLLEFLSQQQLHPEEDIQKAKLDLLQKTNMVDYAMDIYKDLYNRDDVPSDMRSRRHEVVQNLKSLQVRSRDHCPSAATACLPALRKELQKRISQSSTYLSESGRSISEPDFALLQAQAETIVAFLSNESSIKQLKQDKAYNLQLLQEEYQIGPAQIDALFYYAKFQFECGNYSAAAEFLYHFR